MGKKHTVTTTTLLDISLGPRKKQETMAALICVRFSRKLAYSIEVKKVCINIALCIYIYVYVMYTCNKKNAGPQGNKNKARARERDNRHVMRSGDGACVGKW